MNHFPLSFAQQRLWFIDQLLPNSPLYNIPIALKLEGRLNLEALKNAFNDLIDRHEVFRTTIISDREIPQQVISMDNSFHMKFNDLSSFSAHEKEIRLSDLMRCEASGPFNLSEGSLVRVQLLKLEDNLHVLSITMHHIISDGWSIEILFRELGEFYNFYNSGKPLSLQSLPIQYADFSVWQRDLLECVFR